MGATLLIYTSLTGCDFTNVAMRCITGLYSLSSHSKSHMDLTLPLAMVTTAPIFLINCRHAPQSCSRLTRYIPLYLAGNASRYSFHKMSLSISTSKSGAPLATIS